ncbi:hypothetical protein GGR58DRAFT_380927 [Xylaria digitata]|nr:hypothetical protein GGR58DRAFT_380927 [Xylaria digitata]
MRTRSRRQQMRAVLSRQDDKRLSRGSSRKSAISSVSENSLGRSEGESGTLLTPTRIRLRDKLSPSKGQDRIEENSMDIASPNLALQGASSPPGAQKAEESYPGHVLITHFDFSKYKPGTPGSESHPIKIEEDSPDGSSFTVLPTGLGGLPATGISIITSPKAATSFLHCFLAAEKYWLRSCDHDMDPDIKFWKKLLAQFNANRLGYQIDTWETARLMASTLCSQSYKMHFQQRPASADDGIPCLISAIEDCRRMSKRRRWGQRRECESVKTPSNDVATEEDIQKGLLSRKPATLEDHQKLMQALRKSCAKNGNGYNPETEASTTGLGVNHRSTRKGVHPNPYTPSLHGSSTRSGNTKPNAPRNFPRDPGAAGRDPNRIFKRRRVNRPRGGHPYSSAREGGGSRRGAPSRYTTQEKDGLERRLRELEYEIKSMRQPRCD